MTSQAQPQELAEHVALAGTLPREQDADGRLANYEPSFVARLGAELFGSFLLVLVGLALAIYATQLDVGILGVALGLGLALMAGLATVGHLSGHFNPAITLGSALAGRTQWRDVLPLWLSQLVGGAIAAAIIFLTIPTSLFGPDKFSETARALMGRAANGFDSHAPMYTVPRSEFFEQIMSQGVSRTEIEQAFSAGQEGLPTWPTVPLVSALLIEVVATALFVGVFLAVTSKISRAKNAPIVIGLTFTVLLLVATPFTNGSLNPARSFASAIFAESWALGQLWLFFAAPLLGAAIAGVVYRLAVVRPEPALAAPVATEDFENSADFDDLEGTDTTDTAAVVDIVDEDEVGLVGEDDLIGSVPEELDDELRAGDLDDAGAPDDVESDDVESDELFDETDPEQTGR